MIKDPGFTIQNVWTRFGHGGFLPPPLNHYAHEVSMLSLMAAMRDLDADWNDVLNVELIRNVIRTTDEIADGIWRGVPSDGILDAFVQNGYIEWVEKPDSFRVTQKFVDFCRKHRFEETEEPIYAKEPIYAPKRWWHTLLFLSPKITGHRKTDEVIGHKPVYLRVTT